MANNHFFKAVLFAAIAAVAVALSKTSLRVRDARYYNAMCGYATQTRMCCNVLPPMDGMKRRGKPPHEKFLCFNEGKTSASVIRCQQCMGVYNGSETVSGWPVLREMVEKLETDGDFCKLELGLCIMAEEDEVWLPCKRMCFIQARIPGVLTTQCNIHAGQDCHQGRAVRCCRDAEHQEHPLDLHRHHRICNCRVDTHPALLCTWPVRVGLCHVSCGVSSKQSQTCYSAPANKTPAEYRHDPLVVAV